MDRVKLYCGGACRGEVTLRREGARTQVRAAMEDPGDGLYRAALAGERGELALGVMEPAGGQLTVCRRFYSRDVEALGPLRRGEARRSFPFGTVAWRETDRPAELVREPFIRSRLEPLGRAWWRREGERLVLALPLETDGPFPLEALFCLARVEQVEGRACAVFVFDGEQPALP